MLEATGAVSGRAVRQRIMDSNPIEQERGVTIKLAPVTMTYRNHQLNVIDTPGHVDFRYEVSRSLAACEGVVLLIDATQGIEAQTLAHWEQADQLGLRVLPVLNKVDLPAARVEEVMLEAMDSFGFGETEFLIISAKTGQGVTALLDAIVDRLPPPDGAEDGPLRALVVSSRYDHHQGVIAYARVVDGQLDHQQLRLLASDTTFKPVELGYFAPQPKSLDRLLTGQVGYVATGLKDSRRVKVGDTLTTAKLPAQPLTGYREPTPMVYMALFPSDADEFSKLTESIGRLALHDPALQFHSLHSQAIGNGLQVGFLGVFHAEIVIERLRREFEMELIATAPTVPYRAKLANGRQLTVTTPAELPDPSQLAEVTEPVVTAGIMTPDSYVSAITQLLHRHRGTLTDSTPLGQRLRLTTRLPLAELVVDFYDELKSASSGYASLDYRVTGYQPVELVKLTVLINRELVDALGQLVTADQAEAVGRRLVDKLKEAIPRQLFEVPVQAAVGGQIVARATIKAYRKDVTAKLYGGDVTRRQKLLKKQARGKKRLKQLGRVELPPEVFLAALKR